MRKRSEIDPEKYNQIVVADETNVEHKYKTGYRGRIQNRKIEIHYMPMYHLSFFQYNNGITTYQAYAKSVEDYNHDTSPATSSLYINCNPKQLDATTSQQYFARIETLTEQINSTTNPQEVRNQLLARAVAYSIIQDYDAAIADLSTYIQIDSLSTLPYWQRAFAQTMQNEFDAARGVDSKLKQANVMADINQAIQLEPTNQYLYYNRATLYAQQKDYARSIDDFTTAIKLDPILAEAYYNRGLAYINSGNKAKGIVDLSKAGELGLYNAYSIIKQYGND